MMQKPSRFCYALAMTIHCVSTTYHRKLWSQSICNVTNKFWQCLNWIQGVLALCGVHDAEAKPVLLCSCNDNTLRLYDLPSFTERGKIFAKQEIRSIQIGPGGIFFTGDGTGLVKVWKWHTEPTAASS
ncbi:Zinc finger CCCH domain-containing protein 63 [Cardamine amara subsp. amara]|uniref:Zinc finger CCCH domain-containing protein 63 n=1 Tax=Cardamine amara subsp. amara TaxID=228776 RepID=A0ABD1BRM4_CARAN